MLTCIVDGCDEELFSHAMCRAHYERWKHKRWDEAGHGLKVTSADPEKNNTSHRCCKIDSCENVHYSRGLCQGHYHRFRTDGVLEQHADEPYRNGTKPGREKLNFAGEAIGHVLVLNEKRPWVWECVCTICGQLFERTHKKLLQSRGSISSCGECLILVARAEKKREREERDAVRASCAYVRRVDAAEKQYRKDAGRRGIRWELSREEIETFLRGNCAYCGAAEGIGIDRVDNNSFYVRENCVSCCSTCNRAKWTMSPENWNAWMMRMTHRVNH